MNIGMRYEIMTPQFEADNHLANFNPATNTIVQASNGSIYNRTLVHVPTKNFAPRFGFSYSETRRPRCAPATASCTSNTTARVAKTT